MTGRRTDEPHRASTPLELLFDLCFVVAVAQASGALRQELVDHRVGHAVGSYAAVFFAIWWAWMNVTWFGSAYDTDDVPYRLATLLQITGALMLAAGVPRAFSHADFHVVTLGYVVMRIALVGQWLRAAHGDRTRRVTALRFAAGVSAVQLGWVLRLLLPGPWAWVGFGMLVVAELAVPVFAERANPTPYHREHIAERYGLFTLIVLGESVLAATLAIQTALDTGAGIGRLLSLTGCGLVVVFAMWWLYFDRPAGALLVSTRTAFLWGYGHYLIFSAAGAVGAGLAATASGRLSTRGEGLAVAVPVAVFLTTVWALHLRPHQRGPILVACPLAAALVLVGAFGPAPLATVAVALVGSVALTTLSGRQAGGRASHGRTEQVGGLP
jgi:low temperature requirement protein LtrA